MRKHSLSGTANVSDVMARPQAPIIRSRQEDTCGPVVAGFVVTASGGMLSLHPLNDQGYVFISVRLSVCQSVSLLVYL